MIFMFILEFDGQWLNYMCFLMPKDPLRSGARMLKIALEKVGENSLRMGPEISPQTWD